MRLSFVIPAYNEEHYLSACLESILQQINADVSGTLRSTTEIIVVNNASTDRTASVASRFPEVRVIDEPRRGLTFARQAGYAASSGNLIANIDADSRLTPGWIDTVITSFDTEPGLVAISGPLIYYDLSSVERQLVRVFYLIAFMGYAVNRHVLGVGSMVQGGNFALTRSSLDAIGGFNLNIDFYGEDTDVACRLHKVGKVRFTFALKTFSSGRRLKVEGVLATAARYTLNFVWTTFLRRPYSPTHIDIREQPEIS